MRLKLKNVKPSEITPYFNNPRKNDLAVEKVAESIKSFDFQQPILVDENMEIIAGHTRWKAALKLDLKEIPVIISSGLSEKKKKAYRIADNRLGEYSIWDFPKLNLEIDDLDESDKELLNFGFDKTEIVNNEPDEWVDMPEFEPADNEIRLIIKFETEERRENFVNQHEIDITKKVNKYTWSAHC